MFSVQIRSQDEWKSWNDTKNLGQYGRLGCKPADGVMVVVSSNELNIAKFVHQREDVCSSHLVNKSSNIYLIWMTSNQYLIYWFTSKYSRSVIFSKVLWLTLYMINANNGFHIQHCPTYTDINGTVINHIINNLLTDQSITCCQNTCSHSFTMCLGILLRYHLIRWINLQLHRNDITHATHK